MLLPGIKFNYLHAYLHEILIKLEHNIPLKHGTFHLLQSNKYKLIKTNK